jgi:short-subunit dehydrogenase
LPRTTLITGASSGIGAAYARALAPTDDLVLVARRGERLEALAEELKAAHGNRVEWAALDVTAPDAGERLQAALDGFGLTVDGLINNAGLGKHGAFLELTEAEDAAMIDLNITALVRLTRRFVPGMRARGAGFVINVASTAAFQALPYFGVYGATKSFVLSFTEALASELAGTGVSVQALCPGVTETEFVDVAQFKTDLAEKAPKMTASAVVATSLRALRAGGPVVVVPGFANQVTIFGTRILPRPVIRMISETIFKPTR